MRTLTGDGLRWLVLSLGLAMAANVVWLVAWLTTVNAESVDFGLRLQLLYVWEGLVFASVVPGFVGFWRVREGRWEHGASHASGVRRGTIAFLAGAVSALVYFGTGEVLGFVYVPATTALGSIIRAAHQIASPLLIVFTGLFLLWTIWRLGTALVRWVAAGAFLSGILALVLGILTLIYPLATTAWDTALALPVLSTGLWLAAYLLAVTHLRHASPRVSASPTLT